MRRSIRQRFNIPIILVSHDIEECLELADELAVLDKGLVLQNGTREAVFARPATAEIARLLGVFNIVPAEILALDPGENSSLLRVLDQEITGPYLPGHLIGDSGYACVRRSELTLVQQTRHSSRNQLTLRLLGTSPTAAGLRLLFDNDFSAITSERAFQSLPDKQVITLEIAPSAIAFTGK